MLSAICAMYWKPTLAVKIGNSLSQPFESTRGVKQGDPLSPLLFGVFFDRIEKWFSEKLPGIGVELGGKLLQLLLYADDLALLANSKHQLQNMLRVLADFCDEYDLEVNVAKCTVVVFGKRKYQGSRLWAIRNRDGRGRQHVPVAEEFRYLGVVFHATKGVSVCCNSLTIAGRRAMWAMMNRFAENGLQSVSMQVQLFGALVAPILSYCSEVWGPALLHRGGTGRSSSVMHMLTNPQHAVQFDFLRALGGRLRKSIPKLLLLREFGTQPLAYHWFKSAVCFWNKVVDRQGGDPSDWLVLAMQENIQMSASSELPTHVRSYLWASQFQKILQSISDSSFMPDGVTLANAAGGPRWSPIDVDQATKAFHRHVFSPLLNAGVNPRVASSTEVTYCTYENWFASEPFHELQPEHAASWNDNSSFHSVGGLRRPHLVSLLRFRLGAHDLRVVSGRWENRIGVPRSQRLCERCSQHCVEDEYHMLFECDAYDSIRDRYLPLFVNYNVSQPLGQLSPAGRSMAAFMNQDVQQLSAFIHECFLARALGDDPVRVDEVDSDCEISECFLSIGSAGSWPASDVDEEFISCSTDDSDFVSVAS
jgi:hypothetical protein